MLELTLLTTTIFERATTLLFYVFSSSLFPFVSVCLCLFSILEVVITCKTDLSVLLDSHYVKRVFFDRDVLLPRSSCWVDGRTWCVRWMNVLCACCVGLMDVEDQPAEQLRDVFFREQRSTLLLRCALLLRTPCNILVLCIVFVILLLFC